MSISQDRMIAVLTACEAFIEAERKVVQFIHLQEAMLAQATGSQDFSTMLSLYTQLRTEFYKSRPDSAYAVTIGGEINHFQLHRKINARSAAKMREARASGKYTPEPTPEPVDLTPDYDETKFLTVMARKEQSQIETLDTRDLSEILSKDFNIKTENEQALIYNDLKRRGLLIRGEFESDFTLSPSAIAQVKSMLSSEAG